MNIFETASLCVNDAQLSTVIEKLSGKIGLL
jgi:hypothetical protein